MEADMALGWGRTLKPDLLPPLLLARLEGLEVKEISGAVIEVVIKPFPDAAAWKVLNQWFVAIPLPYDLGLDLKAHEILDITPNNSSI